MFSMTGYATKTIIFSRPPLSCAMTITVKTLNSKFFEAIIKLPSACNAYETDLFKIFKDHLIRGSLFCTIQASDAAIFQERITASKETVRAYASALQEIIDELNLPTALQLDHFLRLPNLFVSQEHKIDETEKKQLFSAVEQTLDLLLRERKREGEALKKDFLLRLEILAKEVDLIEPLFKARISAQKKNVHDTLESIQSDSSLLGDAQRSALYTLLDRGDLQEEITRFKTHAAALRQCLDSEAIEKGKRIDFLLQELMREVNTMLAKCGDSEISTHGITIKVEIEKMREQVQNVV